MSMYKLYRISFCCLIFAFACDTNETESVLNESIEWAPIESSDMNKAWMEDEQFLIDEFIKVQEWEMTESESGLRYMIYEEGAEGDPKAIPGQLAWVQFEVSPLGDTVVYRSKIGKAESFRIEHDYIENGIHEAITYMKVGDRAKVILPHHLAHGLLGDSQKIPPLSAVVYDLKLLALE